MAIPGTAQLTDYGCPVTPGTPGTGAGGVNADGSCAGSACDNPLYRYDNQTECGALTLVSLSLEPASISVPKDRLAFVRVIATFSNGAKADVTSESTVNTGDTDIGTYQGDGVVQGVEQGITSIRGVWKGRAADGTVAVTDSACQTSVPWDVVFVLDQSVGNYFFRTARSVPGQGAFWRRYTPNVSPYIDLYDWFVLSFQMGMNLTNPWGDQTGEDRVAIVATGDGRPVLAQNWSSALVTSNAYGIYGASRLGKAMQDALGLMDSARAEARKMIVVLTHAGETDCNPPALAAAQQIKDAGVELAIVTPVAASHVEFFSTCSYPLTVFDYLQSCASPCLFMSGNSTWWAAGQALTRLLETACGCSYSGVAVGLDSL